MTKKPNHYLPAALGLLLILLLALSGCSGQAQIEESSQAASAAEESSETSVYPSESELASATMETIETSEEEEAVSDYVPFDYSSGIDEFGMMQGITALNYVELPEYIGIVVPADQVAVTEAEIQAELSQILASYAVTNQVMDRAVKMGDTVNIDYVGSIDGVPFDGGSTQGMGTTVILGMTNYIPGFLEQLIDHMPGENFDINVTFPEDYHATDLAGKDAVFNITINYIEETQTPELTDEFVEEFLHEETYDIHTVEELRAYVTSQLQEPKVESYVHEYLVNNSTFKAAPGSLVTYLTGAMIDYYAYYANAYGLDLDTFLATYVGIADTDALKEQYAASIQEDANATLLLQAIAEDAGISVTEEDLVAYFEDLTGSPDYSSYEEEYGRNYLVQAVLFDKVQEYVCEKAVIE